MRGAQPTDDEDHYEQAQDLVQDVEVELKAFIKEHVKQLTNDLHEQLTKDGQAARRREDERYRSRLGEVSDLIAENTLAKLEREIQALKQSRIQGELFAEAERLDRIDRSIEEKEVEQARRKRNYEDVRQQLEKERARILDHVLPKRYALTNTAQVFPVTIEVWLPGGHA